jgi:hypothetical protein
MTPKLVSVLLATAIVATSLAGPVDAKTRKRLPAPPAIVSSASLVQQPARMIEARPGLWVSSYGCVVDEGYGRILPCDIVTDKR